MFVREKRIKGYTYLYLVETVREDGRTKQRIIRNLGRKEAVLESGAWTASPPPWAASPSAPSSFRRSSAATRR